MVRALCTELELRKDYLKDSPLSSIYLGGGTPSLLSGTELEAIFERIYDNFEVEDSAEITLEANPDDMAEERLATLRRSPVNRLSIGIQSFHDEDLVFMNRAHSAAEATACLGKALAAGFSNLTADLIYGAPTTSDGMWRENLQSIFSYGLPHLSCYALTVEPKTALAHGIRKGHLPPISEDKAAGQLEILMDMAAAAGYEQYEISNFAKPGWRARHNSSYWLGSPYLGIGPSAHSYDGRHRQWNIAHNQKYIRGMRELLGMANSKHGRNTYLNMEGQLFEREALSAQDRYNEYVLTRLRTVYGCQVADMPEPYRTYFLDNIRPLISRGLVEEKEGVYRLSREGKLLADYIARELFFTA